MEENLVTKDFKADGMFCHSCEKIIQKQALEIDGVKECKIDYATQEGTVTYDANKANIDEILYKIEEKNYSCSIIEDAPPENQHKSMPTRMKSFKPVILTLALLVILFGGYQMTQSLSIFALPELGTGTSLVLLFVVGLLTGFHCIGMCGGFIMSYTSKNAIENKKNLNLKLHLQYGAGKMLSYTAMGALFGLIGTIFVFTPMIRGVAGIFAGFFLIIFGLNMLNIFPVLRKIRIPTPRKLSRFTSKHSATKSPMTIGLLNGLMIACGPLQAIYIYAAGTGSVVEGATALFAFGLGTLPILFGFGIFASHVSKTMTHNILKFSGVIVLVLGVIMLNRGLSLTGTGFDVNSILTSVSASGDSITGNIAALGGMPQMNNGYQEIRMDVIRYGWSPDKFILKKGVPVKWIINGKEINGCNNAIQVPKLGLDFDIIRGEQTIEFVPKEEGVIPWSCWMGMIPGVFIVKDDIDIENSESVQQELEAVQVPSAGSCGGSCGSPTCGAKTGGSCGCGGRR